MRWLLAGLIGLLLVLQYRLWLADGGIAEVLRLEAQIEAEKVRNQALLERNEQLERQVMDLQSGNRVIEQRAREDFGMVREDEVYYQFPANSETGKKP